MVVDPPGLGESVVETWDPVLLCRLLVTEGKIPENIAAVIRTNAAAAATVAATAVDFFVFMAVACEGG